MAASQPATKGQPAHGGKSWPSKVFELNPAGLNWPRGVMILDVMLVPLVVFVAIGHEEYLVSALFGVLFAAVADPGGSYGSRASRVAVFGLIGAALTALGFGIGGDAWGWLVLAAFAVTLAAGLAVMFGVHRFVAALLLNLWFIIALAVAFSLHHHARITSYTWAQTLAWAGGTALWIAVTFIAWLIRGREVVALVLLMHGAAIRFWNYALYCGAIAAGVLILLDLPQPSDYGAEGYRVLWTLCGAGIAVVVMLLAGLLAKRAPAARHPVPAGHAG
jgi:hypothetical protein